MSKYRFVKIKNKFETTSKGTWYLCADSLDVIEKHFKKYGLDYFRQGIHNFIHHSDKMDHFTNKFAYLIAITSQTPENENIPWPIVATKIENEMYQSRIKGFIRGDIQYLSKDMTVLIDNPSIEIIDSIEKDEIYYPDIEWSLSNVRYIKWDGGSHWYAKIDKIDIVDNNGNQKWNTKQEAENAAKWFIENNMK